MRMPLLALGYSLQHARQRLDTPRAGDEAVCW